MTRSSFCTALGERISAKAGQGILRVAITGVDGVGKTRLADELALWLRAHGQAVIRASIDGFHKPRAQRYAQGPMSPQGFYRDSFDLDIFRRELLDPLSPGGDRHYRSVWFDHRTDSRVPVDKQRAPVPSILLVDGISLLQPALAPYWDLSVHLDAPFAATFARMSGRDGGDPDPEAEANQRYRGGQMLYIKECRPQERADILVDYADLNDPAIVRI